ncbi:hypothetical protein IPH92_03805 [Candidatus Kaiserbacteria bacterium]|nr:MAG: hypothetical protein IPH92_03805 [Candidatus Kaiserbacteria bacterium]
MSTIQSSRKNLGFSLVEILVVLGIAVLIGLIATKLLIDMFSVNRSVSASLSQTGEGRRAIKTMTAELRTASPSSVGAYALEQTGTSSLIFYSDIDSDSEKERIRYFLQSGVLMRGVINATGSPLVYNVANEMRTELVHAVKNSTTTPLFSYYNETYAGTSTPLVEPFNISVVRLVKIYIVADTSSSASSTPDIYTTQVNLRNLKDNL